MKTVVSHLQKQCRHMQTGRVLFKLCSHNYQCQDCAYDQLLDEYDRHLYQDDLPVLPAVQLLPDCRLYGAAA